MTVLNYACHGYVVAISDPTINLYDLGAMNVRFMSYAVGASRFTRTYITDITDFRSRLSDPSLAGDGAVFQENTATAASYERVRLWLPLLNGKDIPAAYRTNSYTLKLVFPDGKYLVNSYSFATSGSTRTYYAYNQNNTLLYTDVIATCMNNPSSQTSFSTKILLLTNQIQGDVLDPTGSCDIINVSDVTTVSPYATYANLDTSITFNTTNHTYLFFASEPANEPLPPVPGDDPFLPGGTSETGGGDGTFGDDRFGDGIDDETIDTPDYDPLDQLNRSVLGSNFVNVYAPTRAQLLSLKNYLWSSDIGDTLKKMFNNPMDSIVTLHMVPVTVPTSASSIHLGGTDTEIGSNIVTNQYVTVNCGSMTIGEYWDAYLDYSPYTKMFLYLPF